MRLFNFNKFNLINLLISTIIRRSLVHIAQEGQDKSGADEREDTHNKRRGGSDAQSHFLTKFTVSRDSAYKIAGPVAQRHAIRARGLDRTNRVSLNAIIKVGLRDLSNIMCPIEREHYKVQTKNRKSIADLGFF